MGHYLGEMETDEEHWDRVVGNPIRKSLRVYEEEVKRGLVHTSEWVAKMDDYRTQLREKGWEV